MKYLSVCSGIEAATVAWHGLGWKPVAFAEIEAFPAAVLEHHYPAVPNLGDLTKYRDWQEELLADAEKSASKVADPEQQKDAIKKVRMLQAKLKG